MGINLDDLARKLTENHSRNKELSPQVRLAICVLVAAGRSERSLATLFGVSRHAIHHAVELWESHNTFESRPRPGRPQALTRKEKRNIVRMVKKDRHLTIKALVNRVGTGVSLTTIRRCLRAGNLRKWRAKKRIPLTRELARDRYKFACKWLRNTDELLRVRVVKYTDALDTPNHLRLCFLTSVPVKITLQIQLPGYSGCHLRSSTADLSTFRTI